MVVPGANNNVLLALVREQQLRRILAYMLDEEEFLSPFGVRSVSRYHRDHPVVLQLDKQEFRLDYEPGEAISNLYGGNSNWRGPIWMPMNFLILHALEQYHCYFGERFVVECPTGSGVKMNLDQVARELARRLSQIFLLNKSGRRAVLGPNPLFGDRHWRDLVLFHEYFHAETGRGCGASHQTGWSGLIAPILMAMGVKGVGFAPTGSSC
jgi:hypothetical protein